MKLELEIVEISKPEEYNIIIGQAHFMIVEFDKDNLYVII